MDGRRSVHFSWNSNCNCMASIRSGYLRRERERVRERGVRERERERGKGRGRGRGRGAYCLTAMSFMKKSSADAS